jgi:hypothetical protein
MKVAKVSDGSKMRWDLEWSGRGETFDSGFFVWGRSDALVELAVSIIWTIDWLKRDEFLGKRREVRRMLFVLPLWIGSELKFVRGAWERSDDAPWPGKRVHQLVDLTALAVGPSGATRKHDITGGIYSGVAAA